MVEMNNDNDDSGSTTYSDFQKDFEVHEVLGHGGCSVVKRCTERKTGKDYAVKIMNVLQLSENFPIEKDEDGLDVQAQLKREADILSSVNGHPNILKVYKVYPGETVFFLVTELCSKGELFDLLVEHVTLTEKKARSVMRQLLSALKHCHDMDIIHRDVKLENVMLDDNYNVKLSDFGLALRIPNGRSCTQTCGTPSYFSPELYHCAMTGQPYGKEVDIWAAGVILYHMLGGRPPFWHKDVSKLPRLVIKGKYHFDTAVFDEVSTEAKDLIRGLLNINSVRRLTVQQALEHEWFKAPWETLLAMDQDQENQVPENEEEEEELNSDLILNSATSSEPEICDRLSAESPEHPIVLSRQCSTPRRATFRALRKFKAGAIVVRFLHRLGTLAAKLPEPEMLPTSVVSNAPYTFKYVRKLLDSQSLYIYKHWVKRGDGGQSQAAFFQHSPISDDENKED